MKKLSFAAALAIVAVGGALSSYATIYYSTTRPVTGYNCNQTQTLCGSINQDLWTDPQNVGYGWPQISNTAVFFVQGEKYD